MTATINGKYHEYTAAAPLTPAITSLEQVPFYADQNSCPRLAAMSLEWTGRTDEVNNDKTWAMPLGAVLVGPMPKRFGIQLLRMAEDSYLLNLVWDRTAMAWTGLKRDEIRACCLGDLLLDLGSDLDYMLEQPVVEDEWPCDRPEANQFSR